MLRDIRDACSGSQASRASPVQFKESLRGCKEEWKPKGSSHHEVFCRNGSTGNALFLVGNIGIVSPVTDPHAFFLSNPLQNQVPDQLAEDKEGSWGRE